MAIGFMLMTLKPPDGAIRGAKRPKPPRPMWKGSRPMPYPYKSPYGSVEAQKVVDKFIENIKDLGAPRD
jgi:hypothetical protein